MFLDLGRGLSTGSHGVYPTVVTRVRTTRISRSIEGSSLSRKGPLSSTLDKVKTVSGRPRSTEDFTLPLTEFTIVRGTCCTHTSRVVSIPDLRGLYPWVGNRREKGPGGDPKPLSPSARLRRRYEGVDSRERPGPVRGVTVRLTLPDLPRDPVTLSESGSESPGLVLVLTWSSWTVEGSEVVLNL